MKNNKISDRVVEYVLTRNLEELSVLSVENIAHNLDINRSHLSRTFKQEKNSTIEEFISKIKIVRSAALLKENDVLTIKNISKKMGFCRVDYFIRVFKLYFGTTPARYRELIRANPGV